MSKPNKDGWIRHRGGECPVDAGTLVDVRHRDGEVVIGVPAKEWIAGKPNASEWRHNKDEGDIMAWRPHKPEHPNVIGFMGVEEIPVQTEKGGPLQWRDRIREIDAASKEEEARHFAVMEAYDSERRSLVAQLKAEGFVLIQGDEPNSDDESAQQDMSDPANWRVGDQVEIVESSNPGWKQYKGKTGKLQNDGDWFIDFDSGDWYVSDNTKVKWHSRPTN